MGIAVPEPNGGGAAQAEYICNDREKLLLDVSCDFGRRLLDREIDELVVNGTDEGEYTKYSFPSKTMEYLLSGSKVVMYRLAGIGEEYYQYIRTIDNVDAATMARAIVSACNDTEFYSIHWKDQVQWIRENKSAKQQIQKFIQLLDNK